MSAVAATSRDTCPAYGKANECGMEKGEAMCWCFGLPHVLPMSKTVEGGRCYCQACFSRVIADRKVVGYSDDQEAR